MYIRKSSIVLSLAMIGSILLAACIIDYASREEVSKTSAATITPKFRPTQVEFVPGDPTSTPPGWHFDDPLFQEGQAIIWDGEPETVLEVMNDVIDRFPGFAPAYWHRGMAYWKLDKCELGLEDMERALSIDPYYALAWADRGLLNYCLGNDIAAVQDSLRALELDPSLAKVHSRFGSDAYNRGDYQGAIQEYDIALSIDPTRKLSWAYRGEAYREMGNLEKCLEDTSHAISLDPELGRAYRAHGNCSLDIGDFDQAVADLEKSVLYEADNSDAWYTLGIVYYKSGKLLESLDAYDKALALDPDYHQALINRGVSLSGLERHLEAIDDFSRALSFGDIFLAYRARGDAYLAIGMYENARKDFESAIEIFPYQSYPYCRLAVTYLELDRYEDALAQVANAAEYDPACTESQQLLDVQARSYFARGDYLSAIQFMNRALEIGLYSEGYYYRGIAHQAAGHSSEAISDLGRFVSSAESLGYVGEEVADAERRLENLASEPKSKPTPAALAYATPISYTNKMPITISGGTSVALKLLPVPRIPSIDFVNELSFYFEVSGTGQSTLDFSLWSPSSGGWGINQGNNKIPRGESIIPINIPDPYVNRNGDIYISIRNYGSIPIEIIEIYVVIEVLTVDGEIVQHGALY